MGPHKFQLHDKIVWLDVNDNKRYCIIVAVLPMMDMYRIKEIKTNWVFNKHDFGIFRPWDIDVDHIFKSIL